jgi:uncharacterized protein (UPF0262 family)
MPVEMNTKSYIATLTLDGNIHYRDPAVRLEREMAISDLIRENVFVLKQEDLPAPYWVHLSAQENRLMLDIASVEEKREALRFGLSLAPFRRLIKDYFLIWESYAEAIQSATPERLEAIDMGRRGVHNEGAELLQKQLLPGIETDFPTARRLFTLLCVLHIK